MFNPLYLQTIEDIISELGQYPEMSSAFISDIEHILVNMNQWFRCSILGEHSRMRSIIASMSEDSKWWQQSQSDQEAKPAADDQLCLLTTVKMRLFEQFACAIRKQLEFFKIAKVSVGGAFVFTL